MQLNGIFQQQQTEIDPQVRSFGRLHLAPNQQVFDLYEFQENVLDQQQSGWMFLRGHLSDPVHSNPNPSKFRSNWLQVCGIHRTMILWRFQSAEKFAQKNYLPKLKEHHLPEFQMRVGDQQKYEWSFLQERMIVQIRLNPSQLRFHFDYEQ